MPFRRSGRAMQASHIGRLMTAITLDRIDAVSIKATSNLHRVLMAIVSLARVVAFRMTVYAPRMTQNRNNTRECCSTLARRTLCGSVRNPTEDQRKQHCVASKHYLPPNPEP